MLSLLPAVYCGCIRTVVVLWLRRSHGLRVLLRLLGICTLACWSPPVLPLPCTIRARHAALALLGSAVWCCLGLSYSLQSAGLSPDKWKHTNNLVSESTFLSLLLSGGEKKDISTVATAISSPHAQRDTALALAKGDLDGAGGAENHQGLLAFADTQQHLSLFQLRMKAFSRRRSRFKLKP